MRRLTGFSAALSAAIGLAAAQAALAQASPDAKFLSEAIQGNMAEVKLGTLAMERSQSEGVREFGEMLKDDHSAGAEKATELAKDLKVTVPTQPTAEATQKYERLAKLSGAEFDRAFVAEMVTEHEKEIAKYTAQAASSDSKVAELAEETLPKLKHHLEEARQLQSSRSGG